MNAIIVSRRAGQVLGFMLGDRSDQMLKDAWSKTLAASVGSDVPAPWRTKPVFTNHWEAYKRFFLPTGTLPVTKGNGLTSRVEAWNTESGECEHSPWRQRQSGTVRKSCGMWHGIIADVYERFLILVDQHNAGGALETPASRNVVKTIASHPASPSQAATYTSLLRKGEFTTLDGRSIKRGAEKA